LQRTLELHGVAIVTGVLNQDECVELDTLWDREQREATPQPGQYAHGEVAWRARLHPNVKQVLASIFGTIPDELSCGMDKVFFQPRGTSPSEYNRQWLHVDQNHCTGLTHVCYQGVVYLWPSGEASSTTALWPGSHRPDVYHRLMASKYAQTCNKQYVTLKPSGDYQLEWEACAATRRVPVPAGALLLWSSCTVHQGWDGGPRLAVPVCWEPRQRVDVEARKRKLRFAALGVTTSHSPSEGRIHPCFQTIHEPLVRPFGILPPSQLDDATWHAVCSGQPDVDNLVRIMRPEVAAAL